MNSIALLVLTILIVAHPFSAARPDGRLRVDFLDVGQGDAALITMPDGTTLLVDAGGRPNFESNGADDLDGEKFEGDSRNVGEAVVSEFLWSRGLDRVDYVLATHADADHIDGLKDVMSNFTVRAALIARAPKDDGDFVEFAAAAAKTQTPVEFIGRGDSLRFGGVAIDVLWPSRTAKPDAPWQNNDSIVLRIRYGERSILMTGDIERQAEDVMLAASDDLRADVAKVPHHGSKTSSTLEFIRAAKPSLAVISVGRRSIYGHPASEVVERWRANGINVMTTGQMGTITVTTDGHELSVDTLEPREKTRAWWLGF